MRFTSTLLSLAAAVLPLAAAAQDHTFSNVTIFSPPADYTTPRTFYGRSLLLNQDHEKKNVLLATWENYGPNNDTNPYFPIYQSYDHGLTWSERSRVHDQVNHWGLRYQPFLYEMAQDLGQFKRGDILLAGNSIPDDLSQTQIDLYVSCDKGHTWRFVSHIAHGGEALPDNGLTPVWEPFIMVYENQVVVFYSDQRDPAHGQKLVHQTTTNGLNWTAPVDDVAYANYTFRPGMTTVSHLPNGQYMMTYEFYGAPEYPFAVYYRLSDSPLTFNSAQGYSIRGTDGTLPVGSPYNVWTPYGGENGTVVVNCGTENPIFLNRDIAQPGTPWETVAVPAGISYTRSLRVLEDDSKILIVGGGPGSNTNNTVMATVVDLASYEGNNTSKAAKHFSA